ncbi:MAG: thioredoxin family protein [Saprospiraceae bacterium]|uniref:Thioredoxin family protein n=1 Tax=Candidatus Opimibacter skivensis TaxID=2982028 RepID=A0A9D7SWN3_9BACT|nr:thioredoxin family protein [Candidatus Opimibacter skivensis]
MIYILMLINLIAYTGPGNPTELGDVHWLRSMEEAQSRSKAEKKPILIVFQEIPGCITCRTYGKEVLSHPLIVEAIETYFVPLAIYNNKQGADAEILQRFNEPAWNNPVVRIVDEKGNDLSSRLNGNYSPHGISDMMTNVLVKTNGKAPLYLQILTDELAAKQKGTTTATYTMYCFWAGEALFGAVNGVISTSAGYQEGKEAVKVEYDPGVISKSQLDKIAQQSTCKATSGGSFRPDTTPKYYLTNSKYRGIPMTEIQKCRVNSALAEGQNADVFLSPSQLAFLNVSPQKNYVGVSLTEGWAAAMK